MLVEQNVPKCQQARPIDLKLLPFPRTQLVWAISAGRPERPETADLGMRGAQAQVVFKGRGGGGGGGVVAATSHQQRALHTLLGHARGRSARWTQAAGAGFCYVSAPS